MLKCLCVHVPLSLSLSLSLASHYLAMILQKIRNSYFYGPSPCLSGIPCCKWTFVIHSVTTAIWSWVMVNNQSYCIYFIDMHCIMYVYLPHMISAYNVQKCVIHSQLSFLNNTTNGIIALLKTWHAKLHVNYYKWCYMRFQKPDK